MNVRPVQNHSFSSPKQILPSKMPEFLARVEVTRYNSDKYPEMNDLQSKQIGFNIVGLPSFDGRCPVAYPMFDTVREMKVGDLVLVRDLQQGGSLHTFFYVPYREDDFVGLWNRNNVITVSSDNKIRILMYNYLDSKDKDHPDNLKDAESGDSAIGEITMETTGPDTGSGKLTITMRTGKTIVTIKDNETVDIKASMGTLIHGPLAVYGNTYLSGTLSVAGAVTASSTIDASSTISAPTVSATTVSGTTLSGSIISAAGLNLGTHVHSIPSGTTRGPEAP